MLAGVDGIIRKRGTAIGYVTVEIRGGLGNQLFQYATGFAIAARHRVPLRLDLRQVVGDGPMRFCLDELGIHCETADARHYALPPKTAGSSFKKRKRAAKDWLRHKLGTSPKRVEDAGSIFTPSALTTAPPLYLKGYWQSERYFDSHADALRARLQLPLPASPSLIQRIDDPSTVAVSMHVRRGDYVGQARFPCCPPEYYRRAAGEIARRVSRRPVFFIFSDDLDWADRNLQLDYDRVLVDEAGTHRNYEDMALMSRCEAHVIANSSFSWWGAWLNPDPDKIVYAPTEWFGGVATRELAILPASWSEI
ncbi:alpha-1,2-fucosyltransferase [Salinisphaera aquimarina]|uniref:Alpha-1,2-fucosyltransferase n=1 Tax=Salinisphaera aquimarina TaxID=2094031 RepID=A0ABV7ETG8_9GAMM